MLPKILNDKLNEQANKNVGQLLTTLEDLNCNSAVIAVVKTMFWKASDDSKIAFAEFIKSK